MPVRVVLTVDIKAGEEETFEREFQEVARRVQGAEGLLRQTLCRDRSNASRYLIVSDWAGPEQFHDFEVSPEQDDATMPVRKHRTSVQMTVCDVIFEDRPQREEKE